MSSPRSLFQRLRLSAFFFWHDVLNALTEATTTSKSRLTMRGSYTYGTVINPFYRKMRGTTSPHPIGPLQRSLEFRDNHDTLKQQRRLRLDGTRTRPPPRAASKRGH